MVIISKINILSKIHLYNLLEHVFATFPASLKEIVQSISWEKEFKFKTFGGHFEKLRNFELIFPKPSNTSKKFPRFLSIHMLLINCKSLKEIVPSIS